MRIREFKNLFEKEAVDHHFITFMNLSEDPEKTPIPLGIYSVERGGEGEAIIKVILGKTSYALSIKEVFERMDYFGGDQETEIFFQVRTAYEKLALEFLISWYSKKRDMYVIGLRYGDDDSREVSEILRPWTEVGFFSKSSICSLPTLKWIPYGKEIEAGDEKNDTFHAKMNNPQIDSCFPEGSEETMDRDTLLSLLKDIGNHKIYFKINDELYPVLGFHISEKWNIILDSSGYVFGLIPLAEIKRPSRGRPNKRTKRRK